MNGFIIEKLIFRCIIMQGKVLSGEHLAYHPVGQIYIFQIEKVIDMKDNKTNRKEIAKLLSETVRDVSDYPKAIQRLGPDLNQEQLIFLWERAVEDLRSDDTEFVWFAQFTLRNLASIFPLNLRKTIITDELIRELKLAMKTRQDIISSIIFSKSQVISGSEQIKLQINAVENLFFRSSDNNYRINSDLHKWIASNGPALDNEVVLWLWKKCTEIALTGMPGEKPNFYGLATTLAKILPKEHIDKACLDCYRFYQSIQHYLHEPAEVIRILISQLPLDEQIKHWKKIYIFLLQQEKDEKNFIDPLKFSGGLVLKMPEPLQTQAFDYFYTLASGKKNTWDPTFEHLWERVNL